MAYKANYVVQEVKTNGNSRQKINQEKEGIDTGWVASQNTKCNRWKQ